MNYKLLRFISYVVLAIVLGLDYIFGCHGLLGLPFCVVHAIFAIWCGSKIAKQQADKERMQESTYVSITSDTDSEG